VLLSVYLIIQVIYAILKFEIKFLYKLRWKLTCFDSMVFYTINLARISTPLCYNFTRIFGTEETDFKSVMGDFDIVPIFGDDFPNIFPVVLILLVVLGYWNLYNKMRDFY